METSTKVPLANGLIGREAHAIHGQVEVSLIHDATVHIAIWRKAYSDQSDLEFSVVDTDLQDFIDILTEAKAKLDAYLLSRATPVRQDTEEELDDEADALWQEEIESSEQLE